MSARGILASFDTPILASFFVVRLRPFSRGSKASLLLSNSMAEDELHHHPHPHQSLLLRAMSKRRTWVFLFVLVYAIILTLSWNFLKSVLAWYTLQSSSSSSSTLPALYASVLLGAVFGALSMVAALGVVVPATLVTWISIVVLLAFFGKPRKDLVVEGRKITGEIAGFVLRILLKEGNVVAALCALLGYFALLRRTTTDEV